LLDSTPIAIKPLIPSGRSFIRPRLLPGADVRRGDQLQVRGLVLTVVAVIEPSEQVYRRAECTSDQYEQEAAGGTNTH